MSGCKVSDPSQKDEKAPTALPEAETPIENQTDINKEPEKQKTVATPEPTPVPPTPTPAPKTEEEQKHALQVQKLEQEQLALKQMLKGMLPPGYQLASLVGEGAKDSDKTKALIAALQTKIDQQAKQLKGQAKPDKSPSKKDAKENDAPNEPENKISPVLLALQIECDRLRLAFLKQPLKDRLALFEEEEKRWLSEIEVEIKQLKKEIAALEALNEGHLPEGIDLEDLFEIDLNDDKAVEARIEILQAQIARQAEDLSDEDDDDQQQQKQKQTETVKEEKPEATKGKDSETKKSDEQKKQVTPKPKTTALEEVDPQKALVILQLRRDRLRLKYLEQPEEKRQALWEAQEKRKRIAREQAEAEKARLEAELAERKADQARQAALEEEKLAATVAQKAIAGERARVEQTRGDLAEMRQQLSDERQKNADHMQKALERQDVFRQKLEAPDLDRKDANKVYDGVVASLSIARREFEAALDLLGAPSRIPPYEPQIDLQSKEYLQQGQKFEELQKAIQEISAESNQLVEEEKKSRWTQVVELADEVRQGNQIRLALLYRVTKGKRNAVLGFGRQGIAQLKREITQLRLSARFYSRMTVVRLKEARKDTRDVYALGAIGWLVFQLLLLVAATLFVTKRVAMSLQKIRKHYMARQGDHNVRLLIDRWLNFFTGIAPSLGWLIFAYLFFALLGEGGIVEFDFLRTLVLAFAWYRLCVSASLHLITGTVRSHRISISVELRERILRSVRIVLRYVFPVVVFLELSSRVLGKGYLYNLVVDFAWIGALPLIVVLLRWWRKDIIKNFLNGYPDTRLAESIRKVEGKNPNLIYTGIAAGYVAVRGTRITISDSLSRFKHTRKAFAYLFRRQLEKQAEASGQKEVDVKKLPEALQNAFMEEPATAELVFEYFPYMDKMKDLLSLWKDKQAGTAIALVGETGIGKTTWLNEMIRRDPLVNPIRSDIDENVNSEKELCSFISRLLELGQLATVDEVVSAIRKLPPRVIVLDQCQNLVLKTVGGMTGFSAFTEIVGRTTPYMFWVCSFSRYAWEYIDSVFLTRNIFRQVYILKPWEQEQIGAMIQKRMKAADFEASYEDLIVDKVDGTEFASEVIRTGERYLRLLWDYADGIPRVALHFWLRSLEAANGNKMRVRLFKAPGADELENLNDQSRFVLTALVVHQNLTILEAAQILNYSVSVCELILGYLTDRGLVEMNKERYKVTSHYHRAVVRYLRRKHLLYT